MIPRLTPSTFTNLCPVLCDGGLAALLGVVLMTRKQLEDGTTRRQRFNEEMSLLLDVLLDGEDILRRELLARGAVQLLSPGGAA
jgi:hypothetical protein